MKSIIFKISGQWGLLRILRLALAVFFVYDGYMGGSYWMIILGAVLGYQAIANTGCATCETSGSCNTTSPTRAQQADAIDVDYEEVK